MSNHDKQPVLLSSEVPISAITRKEYNALVARVAMLEGQLTSLVSTLESVVPQLRREHGE